MKIGLVQMEMVADAEENQRRAVEQVRVAAGQGAQVICLPELYHSPYFCRVQDTRFFDWAEAVTGPSVSVFKPLAKALGVVIVVPFFEKRATGLYHNSAVVIDADGSVGGLYRKMHIPQDPGFEEKFYFTPGDLGYQVFQTRFGRIGVLICWDQCYPEAARLTALAGADVLFYPTAIGRLPSEGPAVAQAQHNAWETVQKGHAVANGCFVAAVNRTGIEASPDGGEPIHFWGQSFVSNPYGQILARLDDSRPQTAVVDCPAGDLEAFRRIWPFFRDRRIDSYGDINRRFLV